jgi:hypothetical protein
MDEVETKSDDELDKKQQFFKMMLGVGAGFIAKELVESAFMFFVKRRRHEPEQSG